MSAAYGFTLAIKADGTLWLWGNEQNTAAAKEDRLQWRLPQQIGMEQDWAEVSIGSDYFSSVILRKQDGSLWSGKWNYTPEPNPEPTSFSITPLDAGQWLDVAADKYSRFWALSVDHGLWYWERTNNGYVKAQVGTATDWQAFSAESDQVLVIKSDNSVWQANHEPLPQFDSSWLAIDSHNGFFVGLKQDHTLWQWGNYIEKDDQEYEGYRYRQIDQPEQVGNESNWIVARAGERFAIAQKNDGSYWGWGAGSYSYSFRGVDYRQPRQIGQEQDWRSTSTGWHSSFAIKQDGSLWSWGSGAELGLDNGFINEWGDVQNPKVWLPQQVGADTDWVEIRAGYSHTLALKADGTLWTWGNNGYGLMGQGPYGPLDNGRYESDVPVQIGSRTDWVKIAAAEDTSYAIDSSGRLWGWGENTYGQIGDGSLEDRGVPTQVGNDADWRDIAGGWAHTVAIKNDGSLWGWGHNTYGQVGDGSNEDRLTPVRIGTDYDWQAVLAGDSHSIALKKDGSLWGWGDGGDGQTGQGHLEDVNQPSRIGTESDWQSIGAGNWHSFAVKSDNSLWAWGEHRAIGLGSVVEDQSLPVHIQAPAAWIALGFGADSDHATGISCDGSLWSWGSRNYPELGLGNTRVILEPVQIFIPQPSPVVDSGTCSLPGVKNIDLQVASASVTTTGTINAGSSLDAEFSISNLGSIGTSSEPFVAQWYLSADNQIDTNDIALNSVLITGLDSGETLAYSSQVNIPITTQATSYFLILLIDATNTQTESDESNNSFNLGQITVARPNGRPEQPPGKIRRKQ
ncbi:RCC1 domain-containing protein [Shewanella cyperi]|uniref:RCC1 domain-containing protein n=1 Tax=Shewanella cyperi TaxID=2814292 RepID=UPI00396A1423